MSGEKEGYTDGVLSFSEQKGTPGHCFVAQFWGPDGKSFAEVESTPDQAEATANARRLAAAWNAACEAGLPTAALEAGAVAKLVQAAEAQEAADAHYDSCERCGVPVPSSGNHFCPTYLKLQQEAASLRRAALALLREVPGAD